MKNTFKLAALGSVIALTIVACDPPKSKTQPEIDTLSSKVESKVVDTVKKDTSGKVIEVKKDSTTVTKTKKVTTN
jgi:hypothetical protein